MRHDPAVDGPPPRILPAGTVTFLFSDVEGSTQLLERHPNLMGAALSRHFDLLEAAVSDHGGVVFETVGDAVYAAFSHAADAIAAALDAQLALAREDWGKVERIACRMAIHTGDVVRRADHYFGQALFRCARIQAIGYGEQVLISPTTVEAARGSLPPATTMRDLGLHRLKDLSEPQHVFMLEHPELRGTFPPPKSVDLHPNNLPALLSSLIGRDHDVEHITDVLQSERLVVLTGPGGIGKTRLALATAAELAADFPGGTFVVDLAAVVQAHRILPTVAATIGVAATQEDPAGAVARALASEPMLLVLDNVEQIRGAGTVLLPILNAAPDARFLVTSRSPLKVRGERVVRVAPLSSRDGATGQLGPGAELFVARATAAGAYELTDADGPVVADIVDRLDGLPLAIEIAAARLALFDPAELLTRLDRRLDVLESGAQDLPARQRTLRGTIAWSIDLLDAGDGDAFAALGIFVGGCTVDAAMAVTGAGIDALGRLVDASVVTRVGTRLVILETVREYAVELSAQRIDLDVVAERHAAWFLDWVLKVAASHPWNEVRTREAMQVTRSDHDNIAAAIEWFLARGDGASVLRIARSLWVFWISSGYLPRGEDWFGRALELAPPEGAEAEDLFASFGEFPRFRGDPQKAISLKERSLAISRGRGPSASMAATLADLTTLYADVGDLERARAAGEEAISIRREDGAPSGIVHALMGLADAELRIGDPLRARTLYAEMLALRDHATGAGASSGYAWSEDDGAYIQVGLALTDHVLGNTSEGLPALALALEVARASEDGLLIVGVLEAAAIMLHAAGKSDMAARLAGAHQAQLDRTGLAATLTGFLGETARAAEAELGRDRYLRLMAEGRRLAGRDAADMALTVVYALDGHTGE